MAKRSPRTSKSKPSSDPDIESTGPLRRADASGVEGAVRTAITGGEIISVGVLNLVKNTVIAVLGGVRGVGGEVGTAAIAAVRGAIKAADEIGADLGSVVKQAIRGTIEAAEEIGGELGGAARSAARGAVKATGEVGGDVSTAARKAVEGTAEAARELGADVTKLARSAGQGAVEAAERIGTAAARAVRTTVSEAVAGARALAVPRPASSVKKERQGRQRRVATQKPTAAQPSEPTAGRHGREAGRARKRAS